MKKIFPLIVVLISLSVIGIFFIQMSWINNALKLKHEEYQQQMETSLQQIKDEIQSSFIYKTKKFIPNKQSEEYELKTNFTTEQFFTSQEVNGIVHKVLQQNNIKQPFEFCVTNIFKNVILQSPGFSLNYLTACNSIELTPEDSYISHETLFLYIYEDKNRVIHDMGWMIVASIFFTCIIIAAFFVTVRTLFNQKKISEIKSDFINNMTHELKTPLATISLAIDALSNEKVIHDTEKVKRFSAMIKEENKRMNQHVEKILQAARLEKGEVTLNLQPLNAHEVIEKVADTLSLQLQERDGQLNLILKASNPVIDADEVHFSNIVFNLLDNAMKYAANAPVVTVETTLRQGLFIMKVTDNGIGMDAETQARIFEKFYRAHTGNVHNVKGFGLGLSYVKAIVDAHNGKIKVESTPGKGSTFTVALPAQKRERGHRNA